MEKETATTTDKRKNNENTQINGDAVAVVGGVVETLLVQH